MAQRVKIMVQYSNPFYGKSALARGGKIRLDIKQINPVETR